MKQESILIGDDDLKAGIIYFYNDNCSPCLSLRPKISDLAEREFPEMKLIMVNGLTSREQAVRFNIFSFPTILVYFDGREFARFSQYVSLQQMKDRISKIYNVYFE